MYWNTAEHFGRPKHRPALLLDFRPKRLGGDPAGRSTAQRFESAGRPPAPLVTPLSAEPQRCRASAPFHSDAVSP